jgi:thiazole synthase
MGKTAEIIIMGGGIVALAIALELKLKGINVTILSRNLKQAASHAAAGMLAPEAENLTGAMLELGVKSKNLYPEWVNKLEQLTGENVGYWPCGILAPVYEKNQHTRGVWLDKEAISYYQTGLGENVIGGYWYPEDGQVDNRALIKALLQAVQILGIDLREGVAVEAIQQRQGKVICLRTNQGELIADQYIIATGAWASQLLPLPIRPIKGQMLALKMPPDKRLHRVLFGPSTYLVPRQDGRLIIGATSEEVGFTADNTPQGLKTLIDRAIRLYPALEHFPIEELWWGYRPGTPDELPILGRSHCDNLILATGHYRNGILLAPITANLIGQLILDNRADSLLNSFSYDRFSQKPKIMPTITNTLAKNETPVVQDDALIIAGKRFKSRLMTGTGKYPSIEIMQQSVGISECEIVTVAVRRVQSNAPGHEGLAEALDWSKIWMLPNTAGCQTAEEAIRVARLGREMAKLLGQEDNNFVKLEVIPDSKYLLPDPIGTLQAAERLVKEGFAVLPYINADPLLAKRLEEIGCATVMPLGAPIGSGQGIKTQANIEIIIDQAKIPVVIDAGIGSPSEAALGMELGADALLVNSAIALANHPVAMAKAMGMATVAGRLAYLSGRIPVKAYASASSPLTGVIN